MTHKTDRIERLIELCDAALAQPPAARAAWLATACAGDAALQAEVAALLAHERSAEGWLEQPAREQFANLLIRDARRLAGRQVGRYHIQSWLGAGGMGEVWQARDTLLDRPVALKLLPPAFAAEPERVRLFQQEALAASALNHPNIITVHEIGLWHDGAEPWHFMVTELVAGQTLRAYMQAKPRDWPAAVPIAAQIAAALAAAHAAGLIHRDIKPENVMRLDDQRVKVLDFGIVTLTKRQGEAPPDGAVIGTPRYMSPEQAHGAALDERSDLFALGVVLYELIAGRRPYGDLDGAELAACLQAPTEAPPITAHCPDLPAALARIVTRALRKQPDARYSNAREMQADLEELDAVLAAGRAPQGARQVRTQNANRLLTQAAARLREDPRARLPLSAWWTIRRHADLPPGRWERAVLRRSLWTGLARLAGLAVLVAALTLGFAAWRSVRDEWEAAVVRDGHTATLRRAVFSPDGRLLVSVAEDKQIIVWNFARRERLATLTKREGGHTDWVTTVEFCPDGKWFATAGSDGHVIVWDAARLTRAALLPGQRGVVRAINFSADGRELITPTNDDRKNVWEVGTWRKLREVLTPGYRYGQNLLSPDGRWMMAPFGDVLDMQTGQATIEPRSTYFWSGITDPALTARPPFWSWAALAPDGHHIVSIDAGGYVTFSVIRDFQFPGTRQRLAYFRAHQENGRAIAYAPDGGLVASGAEDIVVWDARAMKKLTRLKPPAAVSSLAFAPQGRWLVSTHVDGALLVWDVPENELAANFSEHSAAIEAVAWSPDGRRVASAGADRSVIVWDAARGQKQTVLTPHATKVTAVNFSADGGALVSADLDGSVALWDTRACAPRWQQAGRKRVLAESNYCAAIAPDGRWVATSFTVYDGATGEVVHDFRDEEVMDATNVPRTTEIRGAVFSADGQWLATVNARGELALRHTGEWRVRESVKVPGQHLVCVSLAPDGRTLVTGEDEGVLRLWQTQPLRAAGELGRHAERVNAVTFTPDGRHVISAGDDKLIAVWDATSRRFVAPVGQTATAAYALAVAPGGRRLAAGGQDGALRLYTRRRTLWGWQMD